MLFRQVAQTPKNIKAGQRGFSVMELLVVIAILGIMLGIAIPQASNLHGQMSASADVRKMIMIFGSMRQEAIRLRTNVRVTFSANGFSWDIDDNGSSEGSEQLTKGSTWVGGTPTSFVFNGLGLARGIATSTTITVRNRGESSQLIINSNGFLDA